MSDITEPVQRATQTIEIVATDLQDAYSHANPTEGIIVGRLLREVRAIEQQLCGLVSALKVEKVTPS